MKTALHQRLEAQCRILRKEPTHWILTGSSMIRLPNRELVTTRRAIYAAWVGSIEAGEEIFAACGMRQCAAPHHASKRISKSRSNALSLPDQIEALTSKIQRFSQGLERKVLPSGMTPEQVVVAKQMRLAGASLASIAAATRLSLSQVVAAGEGVYDSAVEGTSPCLGNLENGEISEGQWIASTK